MSGYYSNLTPDEQGKVLSAMAGLKLNAKQGKPITRMDVNAAFSQAVGKALTQEYMRDPSVVQLLSTVTETASYGEMSHSNNTKQNQPSEPSITDRNMEARGLPMPKSSSSTLSSAAQSQTTRYSASSLWKK